MTPKPAFGPEQFAAGTTIINQGDVPDRFYIITSGQVEILEQQDDGSQRLKNTLQAGDYFGEIGLLTRQRRIATVRALTSVNVMGMDRKTFAKWVNSSTIIQQELKELVLKRLPSTKTQAVQADDPPQPIENFPSLDSGFFDVEQIEHMQMFLPGRKIVEQGEVADKFYIIIEGIVDVVVPYGEGEEVKIDELTEGDYFGEVGLLEKGTRIATIRAKTAVKLITFDRNTFVKWMKNNPESQDEIGTVSTQRLMDTGRLTLPPPELFDDE